MLYCFRITPPGSDEEQQMTCEAAPIVACAGSQPQMPLGSVVRMPGFTGWMGEERAQKYWAREEVGKNLEGDFARA